MKPLFFAVIFCVGAATGALLSSNQLDAQAARKLPGNKLESSLPPLPHLVLQPRASSR